MKTYQELNELVANSIGDHEDNWRSLVQFIEDLKEELVRTVGFSRDTAFCEIGWRRSHQFPIRVELTFDASADVTDDALSIDGSICVIGEDAKIHFDDTDLAVAPVPLTGTPARLAPLLSAITQVAHTKICDGALLANDPPDDLAE